MRNYEAMIKIICFAFVIFFGVTGCSSPEDENSKLEKIDNTDEVNNYYLGKQDFFSLKTLDDLPADLEWTSGDDISEIGSEDAKKDHVEMSRNPECSTRSWPTVNASGMKSSSKFNE